MLPVIKKIRVIQSTPMCSSSETSFEHLMDLFTIIEDLLHPNEG